MTFAPRCLHSFTAVTCGLSDVHGWQSHSASTADIGRLRGGYVHLPVELSFNSLHTTLRDIGEKNGCQTTWNMRRRRRVSWICASENLYKRKSVGASGESSRDANIYEKRQHRTRVRDDISPHRAVVAVRLLRIEEGGAYADILDGVDSKSEMQYVERTLGFRIVELEPRGRRLVTEEVAGIVRWKRYLDYLIFSLFKGKERDYERMEPLLLQILRLGVYELVKLEMSPHSVVNENTQLAKIALRPGAGNLVNALLRVVATNQIHNSHPSPVLEGDVRAQARALATIHSHPVWMVRKWMTRYGKDEIIQLLQYNNKRPTYALRANIAQGVSREDLSAKLDELKVAHVRSRYLPEFVRVSIGMQDVLRAGLVRKGLCAVQDESAGLVVAVVDPQPGEHVIDCCAAPGGKALFLATMLEGKGKVLAVDINEGRLRVLKKAAEQQGVSNVVITLCCDIRHYADQGAGTADKVLLDAPCSGLGVLSKTFEGSISEGVELTDIYLPARFVDGRFVDPCPPVQQRADLRWRRTPQEILELNDLQDELLSSAARMVKPGGVLVYSTCSIEPAENHERVAAFLSGHPV